MSDTIITVQGRFSSWHPAERATVGLSVAFQGADRDGTFQRATRAADTVRASIEPLHDPEAGPITWWSSDRVTVWVERPWNQDGRQLDPVFHADVSFTAKFAEFEALARWIEEVAAIDGATIGSTEWALTESSKERVTADVRSRAVQDAVAKATGFAASLGLGTVRATALADPGMLGDGTAPATGGVPEAFDLMRAGKASGGVSFKPEEIEVRAVVDARFLASGPAQ